MFEKELLISSLKKQSDTMRKLVEELEEKPVLNGQEADYCWETLRGIESALKKIRRMHKTAADNAQRYSYNYNIAMRGW